MNDTSFSQLLSRDPASPSRLSSEPGSGTLSPLREREGSRVTPAQDRDGVGRRIPERERTPQRVTRKSPHPPARSEASGG